MRERQTRNHPGGTSKHPGGAGRARTTRTAAHREHHRTAQHETVTQSQKSESRPRATERRRSHGKQAARRERENRSHTVTRAPGEHASASAAAAPVDTKRLGARPHGGMRRRRRALTHNLRNRRTDRLRAHPTGRRRTDPSRTRHPPLPPETTITIGIQRVRERTCIWASGL